MSETLSPAVATLEQARKALAAGNVPEARRYLLATLQNDSDNFKAWLWLAGITQSAEAGLDYARRANALAPTDPTVKAALTWAEKRVFQERAKKLAADEAKITPIPSPAQTTQPKVRPRVARTKESTQDMLSISPPNELTSWLRWIFFLIALIILLAALGFFIWVGMSRSASKQQPPIVRLAVSAEPIANPIHNIQAKRRIFSSNQQPAIAVEWSARPDNPPSQLAPIVVEYSLPPPEVPAVPPFATDRNGLLPKPALTNIDTPPRRIVTPRPKLFVPRRVPVKPISNGGNSAESR